MTKKILKIGDEVRFELKNDNWKHNITMKGVVKEFSNKFGGIVYLEKGSVSEDEFIIRVDSLK